MLDRFTDNTFVEVEDVVKFRPDQRRNRMGQFAPEGDGGGDSRPPANKFQESFNVADKKAREDYWAARDAYNSAYRAFNSDPANKNINFDDTPESKRLLAGINAANERYDGETSEFGKFRNEMFSAVDSEGNPIHDGAPRRRIYAYEQGLPQRFDDAQWAQREWYVGNDDKTLAMNANLRAGKGDSRAGKMAKLVESRTTKQPIETWRGVAMTPEQVKGLSVGLTFKDKGFQSTGWTKDTADFYVKERIKDGLGSVPVIFRNYIPAGIHAIDIMGEVVINRNSNVKITGITTEADGTVLVDADISQ